MKYPFVTALLVTYNEEQYIEKSLKSLLYQTYPSDRYELLVIDGGSTDKTIEIAKALENEYTINAEGAGLVPVKITYLQNEKQILAAGWNIGIRNAFGEYVVRIDAHAYVLDNFIEKSVKTIFEVGDAVCVGGSMETISDSDTGELIKEVLSSPFGVGGSKFRYMKKPGYVDTVAYGLYRRSIFDEVGYFDEQLIRTQDNDLHRRIRDKGGKFYLNPEIKSFYYSRNTIKKLAKQQFQNGKWTMINFRRRPGKMAIRHFIPLFFTTSLLILLILSIFMWQFAFLAALEIVLHLTCGFIFAVRRSENVSHILKMPLVFILIHFVYGAGSIIGFFVFLSLQKTN